jgi:PTH2 family peptidyl-tRNA hydrolase
MEYKIVIVVRDDLKLSPGKLAVQVAHAAVNCALSAKKNAPSIFKKWYDEGQRKVVVKVQDLEELYEFKTLAENKDLTTSLVTDAGLTEVPAGTITCLGIGPGSNAIIDKITGNLPLF